MSTGVDYMDTIILNSPAQSCRNSSDLKKNMVVEVPTILFYFLERFLLALLIQVLVSSVKLTGGGVLINRGSENGLKFNNGGRGRNLRNCFK